MHKFLSSRLHYGWVIVAASFGITMIMGETFWSFGIFLKPLAEEFGWSRALFSTGYAAFMVAYAVSSFVMGRLADRYGPRYVLLASGIMVGGGLALSSLITNINQMRLFFALVGLGAGANWTVPTSTVMRWFTKRQGFALGIVTAGVGVGALVFAPLINFLIEHYSWRQAFLIIGILSFGIVLLCLLFLEASPQKMGIAPYGEPGKEAPPARNRWTTGEALHTFPFWGIISLGCIGALVFNGLSVHLVAYAIDTGISPSAAAAAQGLIGGFSILGRVGGGVFAEKKGWGIELVIAFTGMAMAVAWLFFLRNLMVLYLFALVFGACHGTRMIANTGSIGAFFGTRSAGELIGILNAFGTLVGALGPVLAGLIFDHSGSYSMALSAFIFLCLVATALAFQLHPPRFSGVGRPPGDWKIPRLED